VEHGKKGRRERAERGDGSRWREERGALAQGPFLPVPLAVWPARAGTRVWLRRREGWEQKCGVTDRLSHSLVRTQCLGNPDDAGRNQALGAKQTRPPLSSPGLSHRSRERSIAERGERSSAKVACLHLREKEDQHRAGTEPRKRPSLDLTHQKPQIPTRAQGHAPQASWPGEGQAVVSRPPPLRHDALPG
jgi:hypothetical protein